MVLHGLQHHLNALHVMARLVRVGLPGPVHSPSRAGGNEWSIPYSIPPCARSFRCVWPPPCDWWSVPGAVTRDRAKGSIS